MSAFTILFQTKWVYFSSLATSSRKNCCSCIMNHYYFVLLNSWNDLWPRTNCTIAEPGRGYFLHALPYGQGSSVYQCTAKHLCDKEVMRCNLLQRKREGGSWLYTHSIHTLLTVLPEKKAYTFWPSKPASLLHLKPLIAARSPKRSGKKSHLEISSIVITSNAQGLDLACPQTRTVQAIPRVAGFPDANWGNRK